MIKEINKICTKTRDQKWILFTISVPVKLIQAAQYGLHGTRKICSNGNVIESRQPRRMNHTITIIQQRQSIRMNRSFKIMNITNTLNSVRL